MKDYRLIAVDLDGTLIGSDMKLSTENRLAIKELTNQGVIIVPTTGRTVCEMKDVYDLPEIRYVICSNGALISDKETGEEFFCGINEKLANFVLTTLFKFDTYIIIHKNGKTFVDKAKEAMAEEYHLSFNVKVMMEKFADFVEDFEKKALSYGDIESVTVFFKHSFEFDKCCKILVSDPDVRIAKGWENNIEIFYKNAGKGTGLAVLSEKLGINLKNIITIGDSENDLHMTRMSGLGLVASNGCETLRDVADKVICSNDEHVMRYVKDNYFN